MDIMNKALWTPAPERIAASGITAFAEYLTPRHGPMDSDALYAWSIADSATFWSELWDFAGIIGEKGSAPFIVPDVRLQDTKFFPGARLNYAENILRHTGTGQEVVFWGEDKVKQRYGGIQLRHEVGAFQRVLQAAGITTGDRVAGMLPNMPQSLVSALATSSLGAVWSSCSPDFGPQGIVDRFGQIEPKVLIICDGYYYAGKILPIADKIASVLDRLPSVEHIYVIDYIGQADDAVKRINAAASRVKAQVWGEAVRAAGPSEPQFTRLPFNAPLFILFSSGTTGVPKCIVHCAGGLLLKHLSEHILHSDVKPGDRLFYFTTLGWMMWNWLISGLGTGASLLLFDGSPTHPDADVLWRYAEEERCTHFGTSAKWIDTVKKQDLVPSADHDLSPLRAILSTGSPLSNEGFDYVYKSVKPDVHLASISGGTDICGCFVLGNPTKPVWAGEIQGPAFGLATDVTDDEGQHLAEGKGELVCRNAFPSMPLGFWNDPDGARYHAAYFERMPGLWHHGDFAEWTSHGGIIIHGRSDATLNPGGVRIGTAEIYRVLETIPEIQDAVCIGQPWDGDVRVLLFVIMKPGQTLTDQLIATIKSRIRQGASPRHVPQMVCAVGDIPRTRSGKISELAVRDIVIGMPIKNTEALANPEALEAFKTGPWSG